MHRFLTSLVLLACLGTHSVTHGIASIGSTGRIEFSGKVTIPSSCSANIVNGAGTAGGFSISLPNYAVSQLRAQDLAPAVFHEFSMVITCTGGAKPSLRLTAVNKSGKGIAVTGVQGVQLMLRRAGQILDFSATGDVTIDDFMVSGTTSTAPLTAYYSLTPNGTSANVTAGNGSATLNYVISYT